MLLNKYEHIYHHNKLHFLLQHIIIQLRASLQLKDTIKKGSKNNIYNIQLETEQPEGFISIITIQLISELKTVLPAAVSCFVFLNSSHIKLRLNSNDTCPLEDKLSLHEVLLQAQ